MFIHIRVGLLPSFLICIASVIHAGDASQLVRAADLYRSGDAPGALKILETAGPLNADGLLLAGKAQYQTGDMRAACNLLEKAVAARPADSPSYHWLGRAYGRRAESAHLFLAPHYAIRARQNFEQAVRFDPRNLEAWNDLFAYYLEAPRFLGGGFDKAAAVAEQIRELDAAEYHYDEARLAEVQRHPKLAERHYHQASELAPGDPGRLLDLARFLESQGRQSEADRAFDRALEAGPQVRAVLYETARIFIRSKRRLKDARACLLKCIAIPPTAGYPAQSQVLSLLKQAHR